VYKLCYINDLLQGFGVVTPKGIGLRTMQQSLLITNNKHTKYRVTGVLKTKLVSVIEILDSGESLMEN